MKTFLKRVSFAIALVLTFCTSYTAHAQPAPTAASTNYSSLWWNPVESGWGAHITHQGNIIFLALYTYDTDGQPLWLVMSNGGIQADGKTFTGDLFRVTGTPFPVSPFVPIAQSNVTVVGTMSVTFTSADIGTMTYSVNGAPVVKAIQKQVYGKAAAQCTFTTNTDRSALTNFQDLWWNPNESGWGISLVHQDDILFAALFVYGQTRRDEWYVMSNGPKQADGSFLGDLYRITGPPFNANPFVPLGRTTWRRD